MFNLKFLIKLSSGTEGSIDLKISRHKNEHILRLSGEDLEIIWHLFGETSRSEEEFDVLGSIGESLEIIFMSMGIREIFT